MKHLSYLVSALFFFAPAFTFASTSQNNSTPLPSEVSKNVSSADVLYSDKVFYSATRSLQQMSKVTDNVTVITREELDRWPVGDLDEALGMINGIVVQDDGNIGQVATAQIYGSKAREVRVMIDGITFNATTTGGIADLSQIPLDNVEKIEIIKGASSAVWGSALGGVINIITRPTGKTLIPHGNVSTTFGEFETYRERGEVSGAAGPLHYYGFGSYVKDDGFRPNSKELEKRSFLKAGAPLTDSLNFENSFGYSESKIGEFELPDLGTTSDRKVISHYGSSGFTFNPSDQFHSDLFYKISDRAFHRTTRTLPTYNFFQHAKARSMIHEMSSDSVWNMTDHQTIVFGADVAVEVYRDAIFRATTTRFDVNKESTRHAYFGNYQLSFWRLDTTLGSRLDATNSYGVNFDPSAGVVFHLPFWETRLRGNVSRAFNAPSLVDRYLSVSTTIGNPDLEAERAIVYNVGLESDPRRDLHLKGTFFQTFLDDAISTIVRSDGLRQAVNISRERRIGFETDVELGPWYDLTPSFGTTYVEVTGPGGVPLQDRPRLTHDIKINYGKKWKGFKLNIHLAGRYIDLVQYSSFTPPADQVFVFDGKIVVGLPKILYGDFSLFLEGENLFNENFAFDGERDHSPKRNFESGVQYSF